MANLRKNKINQVLFVMVDHADFATVVSGLTKSMLSAAGAFRFFGANHKDSAFTSLAPATAVSLVHSGIFKQMLTAAECVYDIGMLHITHPSCADQNMLFEFTEIGSAVWTTPYSNYKAASTFGSALNKLNASNLDSVMSDIASRAAVMTWAHAKATSTLAYGAVAASAASTVNSKVIGLSATLSDVASQLASVHSDVISMLSTVSQLRVRMDWSTASDLTSKIASRVWAANINGASMASNIASAIWAHAIGTRIDSRLVKVQSTSSRVNSVALSMISTVSKIYSQVASVTSAMSTISKLYSAVQPSQLNSVMWFTAGYGGSDLYSKVGKTATSAALSNAISSINSHVSGVAAATVSVSNISDIASAVWAYHLISQTGAGTMGSTMNKISNIYSLVSDVTSALAVTATASDVASAVWAQHYNVHSLVSSFGSRFEKWANSGINIRPSDMSSISNYAAAITDANMSNIASRVWSAKYTAHSVVSSFGSLMSDMYSRIVKTQSTSSRVNSVALSMISTVSATYALATSIASAVSTISLIYVRQASQYVRLEGSLLSGISDILSKVYIHTTSMASDIISMISTVSAVYAQTTSIASAVSTISLMYVQTTSMTSDIISMISTVSQLRVRTNWSTVSDLGSKIAVDVWGAHWTKHSLVSSFGSAYEQLIKKTSYMSDIESKVYSMLTGASWMSNLGSVFWNDASGVSQMASQTASMVWTSTKGASAMSLLSQLRVRANYSNVAGLTSKIWADAKGASALSLLSQLRVRHDYSSTSDLQSGIVSALWAASVSTFKTTAASFGSRFAKLTTSDALSKAQSSIEHHVSDLTVNAVTADDISDIASAVWAESISSLKGVAASFGSRFAKLTTSDALSKAESNIESHISKATSIVCSHVSTLGATITAADMSNIASRVWSAKYTAHSVVSSFGSLMSDMYSRIVKTQSTSSRVNSVCLSMISTVSATYALATSIASSVSTISKIYSLTSIVSSDVISMISTVSQLRVRTNWSTVSDLASKIVSHVWGVTLASNLISRVSDMYSYLSDFNTHGMDLTASAISAVKNEVTSALDAAFTDATGLTADGLKERIRRMDWILQNKMRVIKASGNTLIYKDDNATTGLSTAGALTSDATSVVRKRMV